MKEKLYNYLESFMIENDWQDEYTPKQARAIFTTICLVGNIDADTRPCDEMLATLYWRAALEEIIDYDDFEKFMIELII